MNHNSKVRVLHVVGAMNRAGTETLLMNIFRSINREQVSFDFISYSQKDADYDNEIRELGGTIIHLTKSNSIWQLYQAMKNNGPYDVVHSHTLFHCGIANLAAFFAGIPIRIAHAHTTLDQKDSFIGKLYITIMKILILLFSTNLLACSLAAGKYLFGEHVERRPNYSVYFNRINYSSFLTESTQRVKVFKMEQGLGNSMVIGHIGRFIEAKNHLFLIQILKEIIKQKPGCKLLLVGDGDLRNQTESLVKKDGLNDYIRFTGVRDDISTCLHSMDVFVFPSVYEGLGLVLLEAQASGVPCIVSEAIQPEADIGIGLMTKLSLKDRPEVWAKTILDRMEKKEQDTHKIKAGFEKSGYSLENGISFLLNLYQTNKGESHEKRVSGLV